MNELEVGLFVNFLMVDFLLFLILLAIDKKEKKSNHNVSKSYPKAKKDTKKKTKTKAKTKAKAKGKTEPSDGLHDISQYGEKWLPIKDGGIVPIYYISNFGRVYNGKTHKILPYGRNVSGVTVHLRKEDGKYTLRAVHLLVAKYFVGEQNQANYHVKHLDGDITNNFFGNLVWERTEKVGRKRA